MYEALLKSTAEYQKIAESLRTPGPAALFGLPPAGRALLYAALQKDLGRLVCIVTPGEAEDLSKAGQTIPDVAQELALRSRRLVRVLGRYALATDGYRTYFLEGGEYPQVIQVG